MFAGADQLSVAPRGGEMSRCDRGGHAEDLVARSTPSPVHSVHRSSPSRGRRPDSPIHSFTVQGDQFVLDGKPFQIRSGEMHFSRVPREYWRDRLQKMKAMGLNTVATYMFWNVHQPEPGKFDFKGNADVAAFVKTAQEEGMYVLLRPGPYACAEWEWGGYPYWLANIPGLKVRSTDPRFLDACGKYLKQVGKQLSGLQIGHGGPILMVQVENEYGSYGSDKVYLGAIRDMLRGAGFDGQLYTVDGSWVLKGGTLPDVAAAVNFGDKPEGAFNDLEKFRPGSPKMNGEFYPGWFDQWGTDHAVTDMKQSLVDLDWMNSRGISFSLYMVHGGWTGGFMNGANVDNGDYHPQVSSYYDDTCIDDAGRPTAKYFAYRDVIAKHSPAGEKLPAVPESKAVITLPPIELNESAGLFAHLPKPIVAERPLTFEALNQAYGFVLYRTHLGSLAHGPLALTDLQDRAIVLANGNLIATLDRRKKQDKVEVDLPTGSQLDILVENLGRVNYGKEIIGERKGFANAWLGTSEITGWEMYQFPMSSAPSPKFGPAAVSGPAYHRGTFTVSTVGDTFLDMRGWKKGVVWVNGHNLGRYWHIGAQQTMYLPGCWLKKGRNEIVIFELGNVANAVVPTVTEMIWETHAD